MARRRNGYAQWVPVVTFFLFLLGCGGGGGGDATNGSTPIANVSPATATNEIDATLNGTVIPNGLSTQAWFEYGTDSALTNHSSTPQQSIGSGMSIVPVSTQINGLVGNTRYYFRVRASNDKGETESSITSFTTSSPGAAPAVTTNAATSVGASTATLNGNVTANGLATNAWFEWGTDPTLVVSVSSTPSQSAGSGTTSVVGQCGSNGTVHRGHVLLPGCGQQRFRDDQGKHRELCSRFDSGCCYPCRDIGRCNHGHPERHRNGKRPGDECLV